MTEADVAELEDLGRRWAQAEVAQDLATLGELAHPDFLLVGPLGFILDRTQWLDRYASGDFVTTALDWRDLNVRIFGDTAVVVGIHDQQAAYRGQPSNGQFRATHVLVRDSARWQLVGMHLSPIAAPPGRPPQQN